MTAFGILWFILILVLIAGYFVLDGFDLGVGVLSPFIAKDNQEKAIMLRSIGPVWDGNEVWIIAAGGALFAAFAPAYATTFSGFYLAICLVLFSLIVRAVSIEYSFHDSKWKKIWNALFFVGSLLPALLFGVAIGNVLAGIPLDANGDYIGIPLLGLISPFTLLCGLLSLFMILTQGATWLAQKVAKPSDLQARAATLRIPFAIISIILFVVVTIYTFVFLEGSATEELSIIRWIFAFIVLVALLGVIFFSYKSKRSDLWGFLCSSVSSLGLVFLFGASLFPNIVVNTLGDNITVASAASSDLTLMWMTIIAAIGIPLVLIYHIIIYRTFRGRVSMKDISH